MILKEFSQYLQDNPDISSVFLLNKWIKNKILNPAASHVDKIIQNEVYIGINKKNDTLLIGKSDTGRKLISVLYNFSLSFEQQRLSRWLHNTKASDFKNKKKKD